MTRCVNIDWLEVYCLEDSLGFPHDAEFFRRAGFHVVERDYGTPVYHEMFTIYGTDDQPLIEIRRNPKSAVGHQIRGVLDPAACHVRLSNRTCYFSEPAKLLQEFLERFGLHYQRISRIDICYDFTIFDYGDDPQVFLQRYMKGRYAKINQANISGHGADRWDGRAWNSVSWGRKTSMVTTRFYNKTKELQEVHDKPYIRQAWKAAGLIDDELNCTKRNEDSTYSTVEVWRVEFAIKSSTKNWFIIEDESGAKRKIRSVRNDLNMYRDRAQLWDIFLSLTSHYFHFKKYEKDVRKDRCQDKLLFRTDEQNEFYKLETVKTTETPAKQIDNLYHKVLAYRDSSYKPEVYKACDIILADLQFKLRTASLTTPWPSNELTAIRIIISEAIKNHNKPTNERVEQVKALLEIEDGLFGEVDDK